MQVIQQELALSTSVDYWTEAYPSDGQGDYLEPVTESDQRKEVLSKIEIIVNPEKDIAEANKADEEKRKLLSVYDIKVSKDTEVDRFEVADDNIPLPSNLAEAKQQNETNVKLLGTYVVNVNEKHNRTSGREEANRPGEARSELLNTYHINVGVNSKSSDEKKPGGNTAEAKGQPVSLSKLLNTYTIMVQNNSAPPVVEALPVSVVSGSDIILDSEMKKRLAETMSDRKSRRKEMMRTYLINNQVPPVLKNSKFSYRIPANTNADEVIPGPVLHKKAKEPCANAAEVDQNYVEQEPILEIEATQTKHLSHDQDSDHSHSIQADESAQTTTRHLFRPIPVQGKFSVSHI